MKIFIKLALLLALPFLFAFSSQDIMNRFVSFLQNIEKNYSPEKIFVHTDKPFYTSGETIWLKTYLINGITHKATSKSNVVYVELANPQDSIIFKQKLYVAKGKFGAAGDITIKKEWESGKYQLRSYTNYMRNEDSRYFFRKNITIEQQLNSNKSIGLDDLKKIPKSEIENGNYKQNKNISDSIEKLKIAFYAEGGTLVTSKPNSFGIKATDIDNKGVVIQGTIKEKESNKIITLFRTFDFGLGKVTFTPKANTTYIAEVIVNNKKEIFELPIAPKRSVGLSVTNSKGKITLKVQSSGPSLADNFIIGHLRGKVFYSKVIPSNFKKEYSTQLISDEIESGVAHFTLFNPAGKPECERLVFIDNAKNRLKTEIKIEQKEIKKRGRNSITIQSFLKGTEIEQGNVSLSITKRDVVPLSSNENIKSWLLLNSDLRGEIPNSAIFFDEQKSEHLRHYLLESLMLTHGWRRFNWKNLIADAYKRKDTFTPEKGIYIKGKTTALKSYKRQFALVDLIIYEALLSEKKFTDSEGNFSYGPFTTKDTLNGIIQAKIPDVKKSEAKKVSIYLDDKISSPKINPLAHPQSDKENLFFKSYKKVQEFIEQVNFTFNNSNQLEEVVITGKKKTQNDEFQERVNKRAFYGTSTNRVVVDSLDYGNTVFDLLARIPGLRITGSPPNANVTIRDFTGNNSPALFLLDGIQTDIEFIQGLFAEDIDFIDVLKGPEAASFGFSGAANGVIAIYSNQTNNVAKKESPGIINFLITPFYKAKEFYAPDYSKPSFGYTPDYRTTLHWNPNISIGANNKSIEYFYASDQTGLFQIEVQGISSEGKTIYATNHFEITN